MKSKRPLWLFLICFGAIPCSAVYLYGLYGMVFGSAISTFPGINPTYDFTCNLLSVLCLFFPLFGTFYLIMVYGMASATLELYQEDRNPEGVFLQKGILSGQICLLHNQERLSPPSDTN